MGRHWFWWLLTMACITWYIVITWYVAIKGASDIKNMLEEIKRKTESDKNATENK